MSPEEHRNIEDAKRSMQHFCSVVTKLASNVEQAAAALLGLGKALAAAALTKRELEKGIILFPHD